MAVVSVPADGEAALGDAIRKADETIRDAFAKTDGGVAVTATPAESSKTDPWSEEHTKGSSTRSPSSRRGLFAMSPDFDDLVETSTSLGEAITDGDRLTLHSLSRSSNDSAMPDVIATLDAACCLAGGSSRRSSTTAAAAEPRLAGVLAAAKTVDERLFGEPPIVTAAHAGLQKRGDRRQGRAGARHAVARPADRILRIHLDERVSVPTVERFWQLMVAVVDELSRPGR